jgi:hypothetical protein
MRAAPVTLEAEWYLAVDGNQEGPFTLDDARAWVGSKGSDAEIHCWSEGYDDWLPIEKVSHFRGIRQHSEGDWHDDATMVDSSGGLANIENTPKPLFAATMEAVSAEHPGAVDDSSLPDPLAPPPNAAVRSTPPAHPKLPVPKAGSGGNSPLQQAMAGQTPEEDSGDLEFDIGEASRVVALPDLLAQEASRRAAKAADAGGSGAQPDQGARPLGRGTGANPALNPAPAAGVLSPNLGLDGDMPRPEVLVPSRRTKTGLLIPILVGAVVLSLALVLILVLGGDEEDGSHIARGTVGGGGNLGYSFSDPTAPQNKGTVEEAGTEDVNDSKRGKNRRPRNGGKAARRNGSNGSAARPNNTHAIHVDTGEVDLSGSDDQGPTGPLDGNDLMQVYKKNQIAIKMCYERSLKRNPLLKVPKTWVSIEVATSGQVRSVTIPTLQGTELGTCLVQRIRRWRFRESTEVFSSRFPVVFDN